MARKKAKRVRARTKSIPKRNRLWHTNLSPSEKRIQSHVLRQGLKDVRRLYSGFSAEQGFDARLLSKWSVSKVNGLRNYIRAAHRLTSGEYHTLYKLVRPRNEAQAAALRLHTSQVSLDERKHPQRAYVLYPNVRGAYVTYVREKVLLAAPMGRPVYETQLRVEVRQPVTGGLLTYRDYLFREVLGFQPGLDSTSEEGLRIGRLLRTTNPWDQMVLAMKKLVPRLPARTRSGNEAHYRLLTPRGPIGTSAPRHILVDLMLDWGDVYDPDFVEYLIGVRYQGSEFQARASDALSNKRRSAYQEVARVERVTRARIGRGGSIKKPRTLKHK